MTASTAVTQLGGVQVREDFERTADYLQRLVDLGHHLFRYYVSGDSALDNDFLTEMKARFGDQIRLKQLDFSGRFNDWETALRYADVLRHHAPFHFEQPHATYGYARNSPNGWICR